MSGDTPLQGLDVEPFRIRKFEVGDLVFAKMKGYSPWPSKISQIETIIANGKEKTKYNVFFYGTHQSSILRSSALYHYDTFSKTIIEKYGQKPKFQKALAELERDMMAKIAYLKEIRSKPDSGWFPGFNNACDGLLTDIQREVFLGFDENESRVGSSMSGGTMRQSSEVNSSDDEESEQEKIESHPQYRKQDGYEIMYMENIALPDTNEKFLIVSLSFDKDWVAEEAKRIEEELHMENCFVRIEALPPQYAHLEAQAYEIKNREYSPEPRRGRPPKIPYKWHNSYQHAVKRRLRSTRRSKHEKLRRSHRKIETRIRDEERLRSLRTHKPPPKVDVISTPEPQNRVQGVEKTNLYRKTPQSVIDSIEKNSSLATAKRKSTQSLTESVAKKSTSSLLKIKASQTHARSVGKESPPASSKSKIAPSIAKTVINKMKISEPSNKIVAQINKESVEVSSHSNAVREKSLAVSKSDKSQAESGILSQKSVSPSSDESLLSCPMCRQKFISKPELSSHVNSHHIGGVGHDYGYIEISMSHPSIKAEAPVTPFCKKKVNDDLFDDSDKPNLTKSLTSDELFDNLLKSSNTSAAPKPSNNSFSSGRENGSSCDIFSCRRVLPFP